MSREQIIKRRREISSYNDMGDGGSFPSPGRSIRNMKISQTIDHPWLTDSRALARMLEEEIPLTHITYEFELSDGRLLRDDDKNKYEIDQLLRFGDGKTKVIARRPILNCGICHEAFLRQKAYKAAKIEQAFQKAEILLKENKPIIIPDSDEQACAMLVAIARMRS